MLAAACSPVFLQRGGERVQGWSITNERVLVDAKFKSSPPVAEHTAPLSPLVFFRNIRGRPRRGPAWAVFPKRLVESHLRRRLCKIIAKFGSPD